MSRQHLSRSRLLKKIEKQNRKTLVLASLGIILVVLVVFKVGIPALAQFSLLIGDLGSQIEESQSQKSNFIQPPKLFPLPEATNSAKIRVEGVAGEKQDLEVFVNGELVAKAITDKEGKFTLPSLQLREGENLIKARIKEKAGESDFSEVIAITFDNTPPLLEVITPQDNQTFSKDQEKIEVKGKTEKDTRITINDFRSIVNSEGEFSYTLLLTSGENKISIKATDLAGNETKLERKVIFSP